jgi:LuxR family maltose regulon positive regulatory protein
LDTFARLSQRQGLLISLLVLRALAYYKGGDTPRALGYLEQALELAEPEGYISPFLKEGPIITDLLYKVAAGGKAVSYIQTLLEVSLADPLDLDEPLSSRELEVLRLMAVGASNAQIAQQLVIAVNTVKKHITNIFAKLNATHRTEAVARAREIGLLK